MAYEIRRCGGGSGSIGETLGETLSNTNTKCRLYFSLTVGHRKLQSSGCIHCPPVFLATFKY